MEPYLKKLIQEQKEKENERVSSELKSLLKKVIRETSKKKKGRKSRMESKDSKSPRLNGSHSKSKRGSAIENENERSPKHKEDRNEFDTLRVKRGSLSPGGKKEPKTNKEEGSPEANQKVDKVRRIALENIKKRKGTYAC